MNKSTKDGLVIGLALFATFFGAGNLIFPPALGLQAGTSWVPSIIGLALSGILIPILGIYVISYAGGSVAELTKPVHKSFYKYFLLFIMLFAAAIAVPRTGAVANEMGVQGVFPQIPSAVTIIVFFALSYYFANDKSNVIDKIGKVLTPALVIILVIIVIKGFITPIGAPVNTGLANPFGNAFLGGYQTGDLFVSYMVGSIFILSIVNKGYKEDKERNRMTATAAGVAFAFLFVIYGGLLYLGAAGSGLFPQDIERSALLLGLVERVLGRVGLAGLAIAVFLACVTTSIGLTSAIADYFNEISKGKISYKLCVAIVSLAGIAIALLGVEKIIFIATPIFLSIYPTGIVILLMGMFRKIIPNDGAYKGAVILTLAISLVEAALAVGVKSEFLSNLVAAMPLSSKGFTWILPSVVGFVGGTIIYKSGFGEKGNIKEAN